MIVEVGFLFLISAMVISFMGSLVPLVWSFNKETNLTSLISPIIVLVFLFTLSSLSILIYSFSIDDFSVKYVAQNSNINLPIYYKLSATWGAHEGSLLLWIFLLCSWSLFYILKEKDLSKDITGSILLQIIFFFIAFTVFTSNPFERLLPVVPQNGVDLNPLLQDFAFTIHPPILYLGYAGLAIPFAMSVSSLLQNSVNQDWARRTRPWVLMATGFLTLGITIGSWWAYYELGWGGWWFWDPVENAAFVPWLMAVALIHSLIVSEKRGHFKNWSVLLSILAFSMSLLGTFLVRSGILTSVHAFALDPERGVFLLGIFTYFVIGSLIIFSFKNTNKIPETGYTTTSKEFGFLLNNIFLVILGIAIMFGTLFPLIYEAIFDGKQISVGRPYYDTLIIPFAIGLAFLQVVALFFSWGKTENLSILKALAIYSFLFFIVLVSISYLVFEELYFSSILSLGLFTIILLGNLLSLKQKERSKYLAQIYTKTGSTLAHIGTAFFVLGVGFVSSYSFEREIILSKGQAYELAGNNFKFEKIIKESQPNYSAEKATFIVESENNSFTLNTEKRFYPSSNQVMSEAGIRPTLIKDYYVTLGEELDTDIWSFRIQIKTLVRWIWFGALLVTIGTFISSRRNFRNRDE